MIEDAPDIPPLQGLRARLEAARRARTVSNPTTSVSNPPGDGLAQRLQQLRDMREGRVRQEAAAVTPAAITAPREETAAIPTTLDAQAEQAWEIEHQEQLSHLSPGTRALGFSLGAARGAAGIASYPAVLAATAAKETFAPLSREEAADPATQAAATRYGPAAVERVRAIANAPAQPGAAEGSPTLAMLNPLPLLDRLGRGLVDRDPEVLGELAGMVAGGHFGPVEALRAAKIGERPPVPDAFATLGLDPRTATPEDVDAAYRAAAKRTHPDMSTSTDAAADFHRYTEARQSAHDFLDALGRKRGSGTTTQPAQPAPKPPATEPPAANRGLAIEPDRRAMESEARDLSLETNRTPAQDARLQDLNVSAKRTAPAAATTPGEALHDAQGNPIPGTEVTPASRAAASARGEETSRRILATAPPLEAARTSGAQATPPSTSIVRMPVRDILTDPARFQFKSLGEEGVSGELKGVQAFNPQLAGVVSVWRDPANDKTYVVNGHHRVDLARRLGQKDLNVQFLDAPDATAARGQGAFINIAEGRGTATDVAKFLRDTGTSPDQLAGQGVSLRGELARDGVALSRLAPDVFDQVATGKVPQGWGTAIGSLIEDPALQREALKAAHSSGRRLSQAEVTEVARQVRDAGSESVNQQTLFGTEAQRHGLFVEKAQIATAIKRRLSGDRRLFGYVSKEGRADELARAGTTRVDVNAARDLADVSARAEEIFDRLYTRSGPLADIVTQAARRAAHGEAASNILADVYPAVRDAVGREVAGGTAAVPRGAGVEHPVPQGQRSIADEGAPDERVADSRDEAQEGFLGVREPLIQDDLFGKPKLAEPEQTEMLPANAGIPTAKLKDTKIGADEIARVRREGTEPEGERPADLFAQGQKSAVAQAAQQIADAVKRALKTEGEEPVEPKPAASSKERITAAAVKMPDGKVFYGPTHGHAYVAAEESGRYNEQELNKGGAQWGWKTSARDWLEQDSPEARRLSGGKDSYSLGLASLEEQVASTPPAPGPVPPTPVRQYVPETGLEREATPEEQHVRAIARALKGSYEGGAAYPHGAMVEAAREMATRVAPHSSLVPIPDHTGETRANRQLAEMIAKHVEGADVADVLTRATAVESSRERRRSGQPGLSAAQHGIAARPGAAVPADRPVALVDNLKVTGATAEAARAALGRNDAQLVTYAESLEVLGGGERAVHERPPVAGRVIAKIARDLAGFHNHPESSGQPNVFQMLYGEDGGSLADLPAAGLPALTPDVAAQVRTYLARVSQEGLPPMITVYVGHGDRLAPERDIQSGSTDLRIAKEVFGPNATAYTVPREAVLFNSDNFTRMLELTAEHEIVFSRSRGESLGPREGPQRYDAVGSGQTPAQLTEEHARLTFGGPEQAKAAALAVAELMGGAAQYDLFGRRSAAPLDPKVREAAVARAAAPRVWASVMGQSARTPEELHRLLWTFRDPRMERLHFLLLDENGRVLEHQMHTSGAVNYVLVRKGFTADLIAAAQRAGATDVVLAHNHPSGNPTPSGDDIRFTGEVGKDLTDAGLRLRGHYVIDDETGNWIAHREEQYSVESVNVPRAGDDVPDWTATHVGTVSSPETAVDIVSTRALPGDRVDVLYLNHKRNGVALEPHGLGALQDGARWLPERLKAFAATDAIVVVGTPDAFTRAVDTFRDTDGVLDVIHVTQEKGGALKARSANGEGLVAPRGAYDPVPTVAHRVLEDGDLRPAGAVSDDRPLPERYNAVVGARHLGVAEDGVRDAFNRLLSPDSRGPEAQDAARRLRVRIGEFRRAIATNRAALRGFAKVVPSLDTPEGVDFYDRAEGGHAQVSKPLQAANDAVRVLYDKAVKAVQDIGTGMLADPIDNYMAHLWKDPQKAQQVLGQLLSKRPLRGRGGFLKERTIPRLSDGLRAGLEPVTMNPIELQLLKMREMYKYVLGQRFLADGKAEGWAEYAPIGERGPAGWVRIDDPTFAVWGHSDAGELVLRGHYWMPEGAAQIVKNYLSPGLRGNAIYDAYMALNNSLNQFQLGVSGFHAGFSTFTGAISRVALNIGKLRSGRQPFLAPSKAGIAGGTTGALVGGVMGGPPGAMLGAMLGSTAARSLADGLALRRAYLAPGTGTILEQRLADLLGRAGGQHAMDPTYKYEALAALKQAAKDKNIPAGLAHTVGLALQAFAWPTMEFYVPLIKLGAFSQMARAEVAKLKPLAGNLFVTDAQVDEAVQRVWHSVDNRFGQVSYDTRFWNNAIKHALMGTVRAVGWDAGSVDELVGGLKDGLRGRGSLRFDFLISLVLTTALINILTQLALTGEGPADLQDVYEPRDNTFDQDGNPNRQASATYMKDVLAFGRHPFDTAIHKLAPVLSFIGGLASNKDFYGDEIRNPHDPLSQQLGQVASYLAKEFEPLSFRNIGEAQRRRATGVRAVLPMVGISPASREAERTRAQNLMRDYLGSHAAGRTPEQVAQGQLRARVTEQFRARQIGYADAVHQLRAGGLTLEQAREAMHRAQEDPLIARFKQLTLEQARQVYNEGTAREKDLWGPILFRKEAGGRIRHVPGAPTAPRRHR